MEKYLEVGYFSKSHGFKGVAVITPILDISVRWGELETILYGDSISNSLPAFIEEISNSGNKIFVKLESFNSKEEVLLLIGKKVFVEISFIDSKNNIVFPGYQVIDENYGVIGIVKEIQRMPSQITLLVLDSKNNEILLPYVDEFVSSVNHEDKIINYSAPSGLIEIYLS